MWIKKAVESDEFTRNVIPILTVGKIKMKIKVLCSILIVDHKTFDFNSDGFRFSTFRS